jgi:hypothetical protein
VSERSPLELVHGDRQAVAKGRFDGTTLVYDAFELRRPPARRVPWR